MPGSEPINIIIKEREVTYKSDYPDGWKFAAGDPFKFPVVISGYSCFIKRFEQKNPENISGWDLLIKLTGKYEQNLSRVYDIKSVEEEEKQIYYVFYEYLNGNTLDKAVKERAEIDLTQLNNDLFNAIRDLQKYEFWFADFVEKNIFRQKDGSFVLVDVDSAQRVSDLPDNEMYGSKDYWILVLKFYKEVLNKSNLRLFDINGLSLNYLQIPFLVLRLKLLLNSNIKDYNSPPLFNQLPSRLNEMVPEMRDIFLQVLQNGREPITKEVAGMIEEIVVKKIIQSAHIPAVAAGPGNLPAIKSFTTSTNEVQSGGTFTLSWQVENANRLELHKNGAKFKSLDIGQAEESLKEFADGTRNQSTYQLIAYKDLDMAKSDPIIIQLKEHGIKPIIPEKRDPKPVAAGGAKKRLIIIGAVLLVLALGAVFLLNNKSDELGGPVGPGPELPVQPGGQGVVVTLSAEVPRSVRSVIIPRGSTGSIVLRGTGKVESGNPARLFYSWKQIQGTSAAFIKDRDSASTEVTGLVPGQYQFQFEVFDGNGASAKGDVGVDATAAANTPPIAYAGEDTTIWLPDIIGPPAPQQANLRGSGNDPDPQGRIIKYEWSQVDDFARVQIENSSAPFTQVKKLAVNAQPYLFRLTVTDDANDVAEDDVRVIVKIRSRRPPEMTDPRRRIPRVRERIAPNRREM